MTPIFTLKLNFVHCFLSKQPTKRLWRYSDRLTELAVPFLHWEGDKQIRADNELPRETGRKRKIGMFVVVFSFCLLLLFFFFPAIVGLINLKGRKYFQ